MELDETRSNAHMSDQYTQIEPHRSGQTRGAFAYLEIWKDRQKTDGIYLWSTVRRSALTIFSISCHSASSPSATQEWGRIKPLAAVMYR